MHGMNKMEMKYVSMSMWLDFTGLDAFVTLYVYMLNINLCFGGLLGGFYVS